MTGDKSAETRKLSEWQCECGQLVIYPHTRVVAGMRKSCGCLLSAEHMRARAIKHGMRNSPEWNSWSAMTTRCTNPNSKDYARYGGAGIALCEEWRKSFEAFYEHVGPRPKNTTLDRIDGSKGYEPGNVRWATLKVQARNKKNHVVVDTPLGRMSLVDYADKIGLTKGAAHLRLKRGKLEGVSRASSTI